MEFRKAVDTIKQNLLAHGCPASVAEIAMRGAEPTEGLFRTATIAKNVIEAIGKRGGLFIDYTPSKPAPAPVVPTSAAAFDAAAKRRTQKIREQIFQTCDAIHFDERTFVATPVFFSEEERQARLDAELRRRADAVGAQILREEMFADSRRSKC